MVVVVMVVVVMVVMVVVTVVTGINDDHTRLLQLQSHDARHVLPPETIEHDHVVDAIQELGRESAAHCGKDLHAFSRYEPLHSSPEIKRMYTAGCTT